MDESNETVLIIDDVSDNIKVAAGILKDMNYKVFASTSGEDGIKIAKLKKPKLLLLDIQMPGMNGFQVAEAMKSDEETKNIPIIFMTARTDEESISEAYAMGGVDYITKPIKKLELLARVRTQIKLINTINELEKTSYTDGLTKLYNHKKIIEMLEIEMEKAKRYETKFSVLMLDIDYFKKINDVYGHQTGDIILEGVARELTKTIRNVDLIGRYGGEEFLVILLEKDFGEAVKGAERIRKNIEDLSFENGIKITVSGGVAEYRTETAHELVEIADKNLYKAKSNGRNRIES